MDNKADKVDNISYLKEFSKRFLKLFLRAFLGMMSIVAIYYGAYKAITENSFSTMWLVLISTIILFFIGVSCGWLESKDNMLIGTTVKVFNYIAFCCFVYVYLSCEFRYELIYEKIPFIFLLINCSMLMGLVAIYISVMSCMYGMSVIINSDLHVIPKIILSILEFIAILDVITLVTMDVHLHIKNTKERSKISNEV